MDQAAVQAYDTAPRPRKSPRMDLRAWRVELELEPARPDPLGAAAKRALAHRGVTLESELRAARAFLLPAALDAAQVGRITEQLLRDPVTEVARIVPPGEVSSEGERLLVVRRLPGVADPEGRSAERAIRLLDIPLPDGAPVESYRAFRVTGPLAAPEDFLRAGARALANPTVESACLATAALELGRAPAPRRAPRVEVSLDALPEEGLLRVSRDGGLALSLAEMQAIRDHFQAAERAPTDVELETLAQTWSEHCKHKTLTGPVRLVIRDADGAVLAERRFGNLLKETVFAATERLAPDWCWSVFSDNAGVVALTDDTGIAVKVETHNHPSALEPYGGAGTGIGGVIRDILGTGLGARPFACTDVFCVGPADTREEDLPPGTLHPDRILDGVVAGVRDYGNRMGIPTVAGTVFRHSGYVGNPLVFAGCLGVLPRSCVRKNVLPGDVIVSVGGRTGRDGIHGATFSSEALHEESEVRDAAAVQIGDPITEKKVLDVLLQARDRGLYRAVTDCGAGGFSSAVGEMGAGCGAEVELSEPPLKYPGLTYAEIWISEAQERMVLAVPPEKLRELLDLCAAEEAEATPIGRFTDSGRLVLRWHGEVVADLEMDFLHEGVPQPERTAVHVQRNLPATDWPRELSGAALRALLLDVLGHPAVASKEWVVRQYDHEVQGGTVLKPCQGPDGRGPGDGTVVRPILERPEGIAIGCGIAPRIGELDPYAGAACAIDEAIRNVVAAGGSPHRTAILDNFCWGDCRKPDRLGSLTLAAEACRDTALAYGAPFVSGKDSLNNEYRVAGEERAIPPTLLCTAVAPVADAACAVSTPLKEAGGVLVLVGLTLGDGGGSVAADLLALRESTPPRPDFATAPGLLAGLHEAMRRGFVRACHDLSEGGLAAAAAEMVAGSRLGAVLDLSAGPAAGRLEPAARLFSETPTRFLAEVPPDSLGDFLKHFRGLPCAPVGRVQTEGGLRIEDCGRELFSLGTDEILAALQRGAR